MSKHPSQQPDATGLSAESWLATASSCGSTQWLKQFIRFYVSQLQAGRLSPTEFAAELDQEFASRHLDTPAQQKNYRSNVVQALKVVAPDHPAIALVSLTTAEYRRLNDQQRERLSDRQTRFITSAAAETIVARAQALLTRAEWADVGAGLAVLMGRRISEILLSTFSLKSPWSLNFSQMAKRQESQDITLEIPTLAPAAEVLAAIHRLQQGLHTPELKGLGTSNRQAKQTVNQRYSGAIANQCNQHFHDLVPARTDKDTLYTHIFRAVYATIAAHWYCPPIVPEHQFKAEIQGHFTLTEAGKKLPNYAARSNYDDYAIGDGQGNRDGRLGIKLGQIPGLEVIEVFRSDFDPKPRADADSLPTQAHSVSLSPPHRDRPVPPSTAIAPTSPTPPTVTPMSDQSSDPKSNTKRPSLYADDLERLTTLMAERGITGTTADLLRTLLTEFATQTTQLKHQEAQTIGEIAQAMNWFTQEIESLRQQYRALQAEYQQLLEQSTTTDEVAQLQARNAALETENVELQADLETTRSQLNAIQELLGGQQGSPRPQASPTAPPQPAPPVVTAPAAAAARPTPATPAATSSSPSEQSDPSATDRSDSTEKIADVIDAIIKWNTAQERSDLRLRISFPSIRSLAVLVGASYLPAIKQVMAEKEAEINGVHERYMISSRHNRSVQDKDEVLQAIARDYLGIPNWQEATYVS